MTIVKVEQLWDAKFINIIKSLAPGTPLREGLENILRAKTGALVVVGDSAAIMELVDGGFLLNCDYTASAFYELAKMDGAIILSHDAQKILYANAQLVPDAVIATSETGTRHRTAERVARQTGALVISISQRRNLISVYVGHLRYVLKDITVILNKANQALQTFEKYQNVLVKSLVHLNALEFEEMATMADVAGALIRAEQVSRIAREVERNIIELGTEGRLVSMQMAELVSDENDIYYLIKDYCPGGDEKTHHTIRDQLAALPEEMLDVQSICRILGFGITANATDMPLVPRGYRLLKRIPRLPMVVVENLVERFKTLHHMYNASIAELDDVEGIGEVRAKSIKDGLRRLREQAVLDRSYS